MTDGNNLKTEYVTLTKLTPHPRNVRQGDVGAISQSLTEHGQYRPIVVQRSTGQIIAGNHTYRAASSLGWKQVAVNYLDVTDEQALRILLVDNRTNDLASYDDNALVELLTELAATEQTLTGTGYNEDDLDELLGTITNQPITNGNPDDIPEFVPIKTITGDTWLLGPHRLVCGDSTVSTDVDKLMDGDKADMVWTDPPYGVSYVGKTADALTIYNDDFDAKSLEAFLRLAFGEASNACRPGSAWFVAAPPGPQFLSFGQVLSDLGIWRQTLVWLKNQFVMGHSDYHYRHESIFYGWKPGAAHIEPPDRKGDTIWEFDRPTSSREHPTMKPIALIEQAINNHTKRNNIILDLFGGSGSTLIAAHQTGRVARLMELDPHYCDVICARYQRITNTEPINATTGEPHNFLTDETVSHGN